MSEPIIRQVDLQILRIPADGSSSHLVKVNTIESDDNVDCFLVHVPDLTPYWGKGEGFQWRDIARTEVRNQNPPELNGVYFGWKSFAMDLMPISEHTGFCGDAFFAKTPFWEVDENGAVYEDVPLAFLGSITMANFHPITKNLKEMYE
ncbi:MAG: hypothetical protein LQ342_002456 [Letrouitia transgressa]|nr:MAG: hypothetical protein LQ342_002456 [Letrouitia transgressa]